MRLAGGARSRAPVSQIVSLLKAAWSILHRHWVQPRIGLLVIAVVLAVTVSSAIPRYVDRVSQDGLRYAISNASVQASGLQVDTAARIDVTANQDPFGDLRARGQRYRSGLPTVLGDVLDDGTYVADTSSFELVNAANEPLYGSLLQYPSLRLRFQDGVWDHVQLSQGHLPTAHPRMTITEAFGELPDVSADVAQVERPVYEIVATQATVGALRLKLGDRFLAMPTAGNVAAPGMFDARPPDTPVIVELVGVIDVLDPTGRYWFGDDLVNQPSVTSVNESFFINAVALAAPDPQVYEELLRTTEVSSTNSLNWQYSWRFSTNPAHVENRHLPELRAGLRNLQGTKGPVQQLVGDQGSVELHTGLSGIIDGFIGQRDAIVSLLTIAVLTLFVMTAVVFGLVVVLIDERRRAVLTLLRSRGASRPQLLVAQIGEAMLIVGPAAMAGFIAARTLIGDGGNSGALAITLAIASGFIAVDVAIAVIPIVRSLSSLSRPHERERRSPLPAIVFEAVAVTLAIVGVILIQRRGLLTSGSDGNQLLIDPYLAATPILLGVAVALVARRIVTLAARGADRIAVRRKGLITMLAFRRLSAKSRDAGLPFVVMIVATALAVVTYSVNSSLDHAMSNAAWRSVGADFRIDIPRGRPSDLNIQPADGSLVVARSMVVSGVELVQDPNHPINLAAVGIEPAAYLSATGGTPVETAFPASFVDSNDGDVLPAIAASSLFARNGLQLGDVVTLKVGSGSVGVRIVGQTNALPGMDPSRPFVLLPYDRVSEVTRANGVTVAATTLFLRGSSAAASKFASALGQSNPQMRVLSRDQEYRQMRDAPLSHGFRIGFEITSGVSLLCAICAGLAGLILTIWTRDRDVACLLVLGLTQRQAFKLLMLEQLPSVVIAGICGTVLGMATVRLIAPGLDLSPFVSGQPAPFTSDWRSVALLAGAMIVPVCCALLIGGGLHRRIRPSQMLRLGIE